MINCDIEIVCILKMAQPHKWMRFECENLTSLYSPIKLNTNLNCNPSSFEKKQDRSGNQTI